MELKWKYIEPLESEELMDEFEKIRGYKFSDSFRKCIISNNGGHPELEAFDTEATEERCISYLLSFNKRGDATIWDSVEAYESNINAAKHYGDIEEASALEEIFNRYVVFADTPFGDRFGGSEDIDNLVSQLALVNMSKYKKIENQWARAIKNGQKVSVDIEVKYDGDSMRPVGFIVNYTIDGENYTEIIKN